MTGAEDQQVRIGVGKDLVILGGDRIEVSSDGRRVTAYTNSAVKTSPVADDAIAVPGVRISGDFKTVVLNGVTIERAADGHLVISAPTQAVLTTQPARANNTPNTSKKDMRIGDRMEDGTVFAGISPDTKAPMYATPADAPLTMKWNDAMNYAASFEGYVDSKETFRIPTLRELNILFWNRSQIGGFNERGSGPAGWYWSSTERNNIGVNVRRFSDGIRDWNYKDGHSSVRLVRS